ncbi:hypothetical protein BJY59DRAFT_310987 [Rhodotorula toruloides]
MGEGEVAQSVCEGQGAWGLCRALPEYTSRAASTAPLVFCALSELPEDASRGPPGPATQHESRLGSRATSSASSSSSATTSTTAAKRRSPLSVALEKRAPRLRRGRSTARSSSYPAPSASLARIAATGDCGRRWKGARLSSRALNTHISTLQKPSRGHASRSREALPGPTSKSFSANFPTSRRSRSAVLLKRLGRTRFGRLSSGFQRRSASSTFVARASSRLSERSTRSTPWTTSMEPNITY